MKTIYLLIIIAVLSSCSLSTHVPTMPNEPMFTGPLQAQVAVGGGLDHIEGQAAISVLPVLGLNCTQYSGFRGIKQFEYGANVFFPLNKKKTFFISISGGRGDGAYKGKIDTRRTIIDPSGYGIDTKYNSIYFQPSIYYVFDEAEGNIRCKVGFSFKHEEISFSSFNLVYTTNAGNPYTSHITKYKYYPQKNQYAVIETPFISFACESDEVPIYFNGQLGWRFISKSFKTSVEQAYYPVSDAKYKPGFLDEPSGTIFQRFMLNLTVGLRLDFIKLCKRK